MRPSRAIQGHIRPAPAQIGRQRHVNGTILHRLRRIVRIFGFERANLLTLDGAGNVVVAGTLQVTGQTTLATSLSGVLKAASGVISAAAVNLATEVSGLLPVTNGGTGWGTSGQTSVTSADFENVSSGTANGLNANAVFSGE